MKPTKTKAQLRQEMENQLANFISDGGAVADIAPGTSGRETGQPLPPAPFHGEKQERTPVTDELAALDSRKHKSTKTPVKTRAKKVLITDDFGEPLRWVWQE